MRGISMRSWYATTSRSLCYSCRIRSMSTFYEKIKMRCLCHHTQRRPTPRHIIWSNPRHGHELCLATSHAHTQTTTVARVHERPLETCESRDHDKRKAWILYHTAQQKEHRIGNIQQAHELRYPRVKPLAFEQHTIVRHMQN